MSASPRLRWLGVAYATLDPRSLALGRMAMALVLLLDLFGRARHLTSFYSNDGLLPNHTVLWRPWSSHVFSPFTTASKPYEAALGFLVCAASYLLLLVGYRTKLAQIASWLCVLALHGRLQHIQNGGDVVLGLLALWTMFLPTGRRYSIDSLLDRLRRRPDRTAEDLADRRAFAPDTRPVTSLAATALIVQLALIYLLNAIHKDGTTWREGSVVHYVLHQDRIVTQLGLVVREHMTPGLSRLLTWTALGIEAALPIALLAPVARNRLRVLAVALVFLLHGGFVAFMNLGIFVPVMMAFALHLLPADPWDALARRRARRPRLRVVVFDAGCGVCFALMRVLARLDVYQRLRFVPSHGTEAAELPPELRAATIVVRSLDGRFTATKAAAFRELGWCVPALGPIAWLLALPGATRIGDCVYDAFARRRARLSVALGLGACGVGSPVPAPVATPAVRGGGFLGVLREYTVLALMLLSFRQLVSDNRAVRSWIDFTPSPALRAAVDYLQLYQGWSMFAPEAPQQDFNLVVDAVTRDGRHVDPFNEVASPGAPTPGFTSPRALGQDWLFCDYVVGIANRGEQHQAFIEWVQRYRERTGRPEDAIVRFDAYIVTDDSPPPGEREPTNVRSQRFLRWPTSP